MTKPTARAAFEIGSRTVAAGQRLTVDLPVSVMSDHTPVAMSVHVIHGRQDGPVMFVSAAVHGDEIIGVEILRRLLRAAALRSLKGTLLAVPIVNSFGFINRSRYLPDRRDLNRSFPGSAGGSLASRLAHLFLTEVVARAQVGIDLHSASIHRSNLPQIRVSPAHPSIMELAHAFGAPLILTSKVREGSLRQAARARGVDVLLYEAGEGLRFDEFAVRVGVTGILRTMRHLGMLSGTSTPRPGAAPMLSTRSSWVRAPAGGLLRTFRTIGQPVTRGDLLGMISDPFGNIETEVRAESTGLLIGRTNLPIVNEGDGLFHIARLEAAQDPGRTLERLGGHLEEHPLFDEDEII